MGDVDAYTALSSQLALMQDSLQEVREDIREIRMDVRNSKASIGQYVANGLVSVMVAFLTVWLTSMGIHTPGSGRVSNGNA